MANYTGKSVKTQNFSLAGVQTLVWPAQVKTWTPVLSTVPLGFVPLFAIKGGILGLLDRYYYQLMAQFRQQFFTRGL